MACYAKRSSKSVNIEDKTLENPYINYYSIMFNLNYQSMYIQ